MLVKRNLKADLAALALLAASVFLALSLATYDRADPVPGQQVWSQLGFVCDTLVYPPNQQALNLCGRSGALLSHALLSGIGVGSYLLLATFVVIDARVLKRQPISEPLVRAVGWLLTLLAMATLAALVLPDLSQGPAIGPGGYLGAIGSAVLDRYFATAGGCLLAASILIAGLLLWTDYVLFRCAWRYILQPLCLLVLSRLRPNDKRNARKLVRGRDDLSDAPSIRIGRKTVETTVSSEESPPIAKSEPAEEPTDGKDKPSSDPRSLRVNTPSKNERETVMEQLEAASQSEDDTSYELPSIDLLLKTEKVSYEAHEKDVRQKAKILEETFTNFGYNVRVVEIDTGPVIAQFEVELEAGLRLSKITGLADDLAIALRVPSVRIVAPIPGKNTVGIEVPNAERQLVRLREVFEEGMPLTRKMQIPIFLGQDVSGNPLVFDLTTMPHLLIAGRTGTGKSVCLNTIIVSMLMTRRPDEVKMLMIDPKMVELSPYKKLPHLMHPVVTDMKKAEAILAWAVDKMEERYALLARAGVRHMSVYNQLGEEELRRRLQPENDEQWLQIPKHLPFIVIVADEIADLMMTAAKEVESHIIRLAQKSRAVGIHLVLATQKPTVDVVTGLIKSNLPARIAFQVASRTDSRVVLDEMGADKLLGNGDMLFLWPGTSTLLRGQGTYISDDEINSIIDCVSTNEPQYVHELVALKPKDGEGGPAIKRNRDELYEAAIDVVVREGRGSVSLLQRSLGIGYGRAARLIDYMAEDGIVGEYNGAQAREVLYTVEQWAALQGQDAEPVPAARPARPSKPVLSVTSTESDDDDPRGDDDSNNDDAGDDRRDRERSRDDAEDDNDAFQDANKSWSDPDDDDLPEEDADYDDGEFVPPDRNRPPTRAESA